MYLVMVVDGVEVVKKPFLRSDKLSVQIFKLKKEFEAKITQEKEPEFYLVNVPSTTTTFKSHINSHNNGAGQ